MSKRIFDWHSRFSNTAPLPRSFNNGSPPSSDTQILSTKQFYFNALHQYCMGNGATARIRDSTTKCCLYLRMGLLINFRTENCGQWTKDKNSVFRYSRLSSLVFSLFSGDGSFHVDLQGIKEGQRRTHAVMAKG